MRLTPRGAHSKVETLTANVAKRVLDENPGRKSAIVFNNSASDVYLGFNADVRTSGGTRGLTLKSAGGSWTTGEPGPYTGQVYVISTGGVDVDVTEEAEW